MQNAPLNKNLLTWLIVVVVIGVVYLLITLFSGGGGFSTRDIPEPTGLSGSEPVQTTSQPASTPPPTGGAAGPSIGGTSMVGVSAGGGETTAGVSPEAGGERPGEEVPSPGPAAVEMTEKQKMDELAAFEAIDSRDIIAARMEEAKGKETPVDAEEGIPYEDVGRVDPLAIVSTAIPEELRPPRSGETDYDEILDFLITAYGTALLDSVQIEVWSVMQMGLEKMVNMSVNQQLMTLPEGGSYPVDVGGATVMMTVSSASQSIVVITLSFNSGYTSVSKTKTFVPKD